MIALHTKQIAVCFILFCSICFWLCWVSVAAQAFFSSCGEWGLLSSCSVWTSYCGGFFHCRVHDLGHAGFSTWAPQLRLPGSRTHAQQLGYTGLAAPCHVGSSLIMNQAHVSCIGRQIIDHRALREASTFFKIQFYKGDSFSAKIPNCCRSLPTQKTLEFLWVIFFVSLRPYYLILFSGLCPTQKTNFTCDLCKATLMQQEKDLCNCSQKTLTV